ncbi:BrnA antitoxin family protein [Mesorhizobium sp. 1B3]|uniref:BrnA antitoxin family protein n=1 Tax=Mesorhizobium sp. 1B3 TaxID=3243599 RepID=UPI003D9A010B
MTKRWPCFVTKDLGGPNGEWSDADEAELYRRWETYDREMRALIAAGGVHQDDDGWWVDDTTGELIGPDPEIERPLTQQELASARPFAEAQPEIYAAIQRNKVGRPKSENPKQAVTIRLDADVVGRLKAGGKGWQTRANDLLRKAVGLK